MLPDPELETLRVPERGLTLMPILGGSDSAGAGLHVDGTLDWIAYPLAEAWDDPRGRRRRPRSRRCSATSAPACCGSSRARGGSARWRRCCSPCRAPPPTTSARSRPRVW